jgi:hypothetical protein
MYSGSKCRRHGSLEEHDHFDFAEDEVFCNRDHIIVNQNWKKLQAMWKTFNADYKAALLTHFTLSGTHDSNFFSLLFETAFGQRIRA